MLKIRLQRIGRKNDPSYRVVVVESTQGPKSGKFIENIGTYNPKGDAVAVNGERAKYWMGVGAQVSGTVHNILVKEKVIDGKKINVLPKKTPIVSEEETKEEVPQEVATEGVEEASEQGGEEVVEEKVETSAEETPKEEVSGEEKVEETPTEEGEKAVA